MSTMLLDDYDYDSEADYDGEAEDYDSEGEDYEAEDYDGEGEGEDFENARRNALRRQRAARARRIRAARARQVRAARQRSAQARRRGVAPAPRPAPTTPRQTVAAIRTLDLENKVGEDSLRTAIARSNRRATRATYATVAGVAINQAFDTFEKDLDGHEFVRAGLRLSPLLLLSPQRRPGVEGVLLDPRVMGAAAVAGLVAVGQFRERDDDVASIEIDRNELDVSRQQGQLLAAAVNKKGADTGREIIWTSSGHPGFTLDKAGHFTISGSVDAGSTVRVTATAGDISKTFFLRFRESDGGSGGGGTAAKKAAGGGGS